MSSEPPSEDRPTGPPSGPLSGGGGSGSGRPGPAGPPPEPTRPDWHSTPSGEGSTQISGPTGAQPPEPPGPPAPPSGAHGAPPPAGEPGRAWWRSAPKVALVAGVLVAAAALLVFFLRPEGGGEVFLQAASAHGNDPFTASTAKDAGTKEAAAAPVTPAEGGNRTYPGSTQGLYGGTQNAASCDVDRQVRYLRDDQAKSRAFASAAGIQQSETEHFLRGLTPLLLRSDTRVTNHGYKDGAATAFQSVLQAGTAVLVDNRGMPRVRCACGNPLGPPVAAKSSAKTKGEGWSGYKSSNAVAVTEATTAIYDMVVYDPVSRQWFERPVGTDGGSDRPVPKPSGAMPSGSASQGPEESSSGGPPKPSSSAPPPPSQSPPSPQKPATEPGPAYGPQNRGLARPGGAA